MLVKKHITFHSFPAHAAVCDKTPIHPYNSQPTREHATNHITPHTRKTEKKKKRRVISEITALKNWGTLWRDGKEFRSDRPIRPATGLNKTWRTESLLGPLETAKPSVVKTKKTKEHFGSGRSGRI